MHKIEYNLESEGLWTYKNEFDKWDGDLTEDDYETIAQNICREHASDHQTYNYFPCDVELIINGESVGIFNVELQAVPEFTAKRVK